MARRNKRQWTVSGGVDDDVVACWGRSRFLAGCSRPTSLRPGAHEVGPWTGCTHGHLRTDDFRDLDGEGTHPPPAPITITCWPDWTRPPSTQALQLR